MHGAAPSGHYKPQRVTQAHHARSSRIRSRTNRLRLADFKSITDPRRYRSGDPKSTLSGYSTACSNWRWLYFAPGDDSSGDGHCRGDPERQMVALVDGRG